MQHNTCPVDSEASNIPHHRPTSLSVLWQTIPTTEAFESLPLNNGLKCAFDFSTSDAGAAPQSLDGVSIIYDACSIAKAGLDRIFNDDLIEAGQSDGNVMKGVATGLLLSTLLWITFFLLYAAL